ncbi:MAG: transcription-repair coupling factor [Pseudomonadota bacterium]
MDPIDAILTSPGRIEVHGAPPGADAIALGRIGARGRDVLHVARDDARMAALAEALAFFHPTVPALTFPAWDCLPYDRVAPNGEVVSRRIDTLATLAAAKAPLGRVVITTVNAIVQRVPAHRMFTGAVFAAARGDTLSRQALLDFLSHNGYRRAETVREPGEYAIRGGIVDLFPPGVPDPMRLDLFGDTLDGIRSFDPMTQRSADRLTRFALRPVSELLFDDASIARFRSGYRELFGAVGDDDPLYAAVSAGRRHAGAEHWLPLFHERLETLFDYLPGAVLSLDFQAEEEAEARFDRIEEYYEARRAIARSKRTQADGPPYNPLPPDRLYLDRAGWRVILAARAGAVFSPFAPAAEAAVDADLGGRPGLDFAAVRAQPGVRLFDALRVRLEAEIAAGRRVLIAAYSAGSRERLAGLLRDHGVGDARAVDGLAAALALPAATTGLVVLGLERGFSTGDLTAVSEQDILGERLVRAAKRRRRPDNFLVEASTLADGDVVVHVDHGIGRFDGLARLDVAGAPHDCLRLIYAGGDKLFVPVENIDVLSRYGSEEAGAELDRLGGVQWQARKARVKERIGEIAGRLMKIAAERQLRDGERLAPPEGLYDEFCARFPYPETEDQARAIDEVLADLAAGRPMDRLICGDVGFGKTEVALRAAFIAAMAGAQVAVVVPTTLLCRQHFKTFRERFAGLPVRIEQVSRLVPAGQAAEIKRELAQGRIDIVIGTTSLLSKTMIFRQLDLLVVDEEQHFGVAQKERLKELKANVHVLTLTATPIPRTLQMALAGVRDMSIIASPPIDRLSVRTFVLPYDPVVLREAIVRERFRGGQTFVVCPRIEDIANVRASLAAIAPESRIGVAHGKLSARRIEAEMSAFLDGATDMLLSTSIIESGLDIPTANTLIVHRADLFGLSQLYQLRGRVGRSKLRAYAYLTVPPDRLLSGAAQKRLEVMQALDSLGAGFQLASHDLDIRGAGNLLGAEQSGHIREVGVELYQHMLEEAVRAAREAKPAPVEEWTPQISIGTPVLIPESYIADLNVRLGLYRRIAGLVDRSEIEAFAAELIDRFGKLPPEVRNLLDIIAIKRLCRAVGVDRIEAGPKGAVVSFRDNRFARPDKLVAFITRQPDGIKLRPDHKLVFMRAWEEPETRLSGINRLLATLAKLAA